MAVGTTAAADDLLKVTLDKYRGKLVDQIFNKHVLSWFLMENNRTRMDSGGNQIIEHLLIDDNKDTKEYSEWEDVAIRPQGGIETAAFDWKSLVTTIAISGMEEFKNQGKEQILNLLKARVMQAEKTLQKMVNDQLWGEDPTGFNSVLDLVSDSGTVGGIDRTTATWWRSPVTDLASGAGDFDEYFNTFVNLYNTASDGTDVVKGAVADQASWETYMLGLTPNVRFTDQKAAGLGFQNVAIMGVPLYWDKAAPAGTTVAINPESLTVVGGKGRWFKQSPFTANPIDAAGIAAGGASFRDARYAVITAYGNVTTNQPRRNFKITGFGQ